MPRRKPTSPLPSAPKPELEPLLTMADVETKTPLIANLEAWQFAFAGKACDGTRIECTNS